MIGCLIYNAEKQRRLQDLEKVQQLESKLHSELEHLDAKVAKMHEGLAKYNNLTQVKADAEAKKKVRNRH